MRRTVHINVGRVQGVGAPARSRARHNEASAIANAEERGELRERRKNVQTMIAKGMDVSTIAEITGLTVDEILHLK